VTITLLIDSFSKPGDIVLDPFAGSARPLPLLLLVGSGSYSLRVFEILPDRPTAHPSDPTVLSPPANSGKFFLGHPGLSPSKQVVRIPWRRRQIIFPL